MSTILVAGATGYTRSTMSSPCSLTWRRRTGAGSFSSASIRLNVRTPLGAIERGGWRLVYRDKPDFLAEIVKPRGK